MDRIFVYPDHPFYLVFFFFDKVTFFVEGHMFIVFFLFLFVRSVAYGHDGHVHLPTWLDGVGRLHLILLHFPIAFINMLALFEVLAIKDRRPLYELTCRSLVVAAAVTTPIAALLGFIYSYSGHYEGAIGDVLFWHMWLGILTAVLAVALWFVREKGIFYYSILIALFLLVNFTTYFGGEMTFGPNHLLTFFFKRGI